MQLLTWNLNWASPGSPRGQALLSAIEALDPETIVLTETTLDFVAMLGGYYEAVHVSTGRKDRRPWQDHLVHLRALSVLAPQWSNKTIVVGDFSQRVPRKRQPTVVFDALSAAFAGLDLVTQGVLQPLFFLHLKRGGV